MCRLPRPPQAAFVFSHDTNRHHLAGYVPFQRYHRGLCVDHAADGDSRAEQLAGLFLLEVEGVEWTVADD